MEATKKLGISYGVMADPLSKQIEKQGYKYSEKKVEQFQKELDAVNLLRFGSNLLTDSMVDKCFQKLHKAIVSHIKQQNKLT